MICLSEETGVGLACPRRRRRQAAGLAAAGHEVLGVVLTFELRCLRPTDMPGLLQDRRNRRVGDKALPTLLVPVKDHPDPIFLARIAKDR